MAEYTVERNVENWSESKRYVIKKGKKIVLRFKYEEEANEVCEYLNKLKPSKSRKTSLRTKKETAEVKEGKKE